MNLKFLAITLVILCLCFLLTQLIANEIRIIKQCLISIMLFIVEYYLFSILFLWTDRFEVRHILIGIVLFNSGICICFREKIISKLKEINLVLLKQDIAILGILILLIPFVFVKSEDIRSSSDMGMYFEWAVKLTGNHTDISRQLNEVGEISEDVDNGVYRIQEQLNGIYIRTENENGYLEYEYHALPTWASMMALFTKIFGIYNAAQVLTLFYAIAVLSCYFTCENIGKIRRNKYLSIVIFALSPIIIYVSKCTLTEISYISLLLFSLYCLSEADRKIKLLSSIGLGLLGFIHISNYMYIFVIYLILLYFSICLNRKIYGVINVINLIMFGVSLFYVSFISQLYSDAQLSRLSFFGDDVNIIKKSLIGILIICAIVQIAILLAKESILKKIVQFFNYVIPIGLIILEIVIVIGIFIQGYYLGFTDKYITGGGTWHLRSTYANLGWKSISYLNIVNILRATSYVWIPVIFIYNIIRKNKRHIIQNALMFGLLYSIFIFTYIQIDTPTNYYASRYLAMTIVPLVSILISTIVDEKKFYLILSTWSLMYCLRYDYNFLFRSSFKGQYQILSDTLSHIPYGAVVLVSEDDQTLNQILVNNLREMNGNLVYNYENYDEIKDYYLEQPLYIISSQKCNNAEQILLYQNYEIANNLGGSNGRYMTEESFYNEIPLCIYCKE